MNVINRQEERYEAIELRKNGKSYMEISLFLAIPEPTVRRWVKHVVQTNEQIKALSDKVALNLEKNRFNGGRKKGTITKRRKEMGEENWAKHEKENRHKIMKKYNADWWATVRENLKRKLVAYKGGCCIRCGYDKCIEALHFHHRDPSEKEFIIGKAKSISFKRVKNEVDKCDLLCNRCHIEVHYEMKRPGGEVV